MNTVSAELALSRIEAALARIETSARSTSSGDKALKARHDQLRGAVRLTLQELDQLIAGNGS